MPLQAILRTDAHLVDPESIVILDVLGPTLQILPPPESDDQSPCVMRGTIPPGVVIPLHSHADPETFLMQSGEVEGLVESSDGLTWLRIRPNDVFHVPSRAKHAFRNLSQKPAVLLIVSTSNLASFFQEIGTPVASSDALAGPPSEDMIRRLLETSERYGYWNASPEENALVGLSLPAG